MDEEEALNSYMQQASAQPLPATNADPVAPQVSHPISAEAGPSNPLSKKGMKKAARKAKWQEGKLERRQAERQRKKERHAALSEGYKNGTLSERDLEVFERSRDLKRARKASSKGKETEVWPGGIVIDLGFDELMTDQEITSMTSQLGYVYSANRTAPKPFAAILHTSFSPDLSPRMWDKMAKTNWEKWTRMHFWREDVGVLAQVLKGQYDLSAHTTPEMPLRTEKDPKLIRHLTGPTLPTEIPQSHKLVYLSADADEELTTLAEDEVYIIGGIVDRNRHKLICQNKATALGIRTARLPIGTFIENLPTRKVLTVNQVFEILVQYVHQKDWGAAFETVIPSRKFFMGKEEKKKANAALKDGEEDVSENGEDGEDKNEEHVESHEQAEMEVEMAAASQLV